jgi:hypothetical protein
VLEPHRAEWETLRIVVDFGRLAESDRLPAITLLLLLLRDLSQDRLPLGFATNRGMGAVKVKTMSFAVRGSDPRLREFQGIALKDGSLAGLSENSRQELTKAWSVWLASQKGGTL